MELYLLVILYYKGNLIFPKIKHQHLLSLYLKILISFRLNFVKAKKGQTISDRLISRLKSSD
jgi:hypothetical protein